MRKIVMISASLAVTAIIIGSASMVSAQGTPGYGESVYAGIKTDDKSYAVGEPVKFNFIIQNRSDKPVTYKFSSGKQYDVYVERSGKEIWRWSRGRMFTQALTNLTIPAKGSKTFEVTWNQKDNQGKPAPPGTYVVKAELTPMGVPAGCVPGANTIACVKGQFIIGAEPKIVPTSVSAIVEGISAMTGKLVSIDGTYQGWKADGDSPACKPGPPVSRSDWALSDKTGCIYVYGPSSNLDPTDDVGKQVTVMARVRVTQAGQPYLEVRSVQVKGK